MSAANRVVKNTIFLYMKMGITMFMSLLTTRLILNGLGVEDYGIFNIVGSAIGMLSFLNHSMSAATQRFMSYSEGAGNEEQLRKVFSNSIFLHIGIGSMAVLLMEILYFLFFGSIFSIPEERLFAAKFIYHCSVFATFFSILSVPYSAVITAHEDLGYFSFMGIVESSLKLGIAYLVVVVDQLDKLCMYGLLMALLTLFMRGLMWMYCSYHYKECRTKIITNWDFPIIKQMGSFAGWVSAGSVSWLICHQGNGLILNHFFGTTYNAAHGITYQLSGQVGALGNTAVSALNPVIVKSAGARDFERMRKSTLFGNKMLFYLISACNLPVLACLNPVLFFWLGIVPPYTDIFIIFYFGANLIDCLSFCTTTAIGGVGNIKNYQLFSSIFNILSPLSCILLFVAGYPPYMIYVMMMAIASVKLCGRLYFGNKVCGFGLGYMVANDVIRCVIPFGVAILITLIISRYVPIVSMVELICRLIIYATIYTILFIYIGFNKEDRKYVCMVIVNGIKKTIKKWI